MLLTACASVNTFTADGEPVRMYRAAFATYVEETFRYHNRVVNDLIMITGLGDDEIEIPDDLLRAEEEMAARCRGLNEAVSAKIERRTLPWWIKLQLGNRVPSCEAATRRVEALIPTVL